MSDNDVSYYAGQSESANSANLIDNVLFSAVTVAAFGIALPYAGVAVWVKMAFAVVIGVIFIAWICTRPLVRHPVPAPFGRLWLAFSLMLLVWLWAFLQIVSLPILSHPNWEFAGTALSETLKGSISIDRQESTIELIFLVTLGFLFWLVLQLGREPKRARIAIMVFVAVVTLNAIYGLVSTILGWESVLGRIKQDYVTSVTGTFVNRNSFACYLGLALIVAISIVIDDATTTRRRNLPLKVRIAEMLDALFGKSALRLVAIFILATALILSLSRAGNAAFVVGLLFTVAAFATMGKLRIVYALVFGAIIIIPAIIIVLVSGEALFGRIDVSGQELSAARLPLFGRVWQLIQDSWVTGIGLGNFRQAFYPYIDHSIMTDRTWYSAHSTYLELMAELGLVFAGFLFTSIFLLMLDCWQGLRRRRRNTVFSAIAIGATGLVGFHSLVDFSLDIPAISVAYTYLLALGVSQSAATRH